ncbi:hypothetical protein C8Q76DRAFT_350069 [Earliella scabrosa]|nr:hypothetical protein C8Q76DRAFT_350069 [Earliella scabrosa]
MELPETISFSHRLPQQATSMSVQKIAISTTVSFPCATACVRLRRRIRPPCIHTQTLTHCTGFPLRSSLTRVVLPTRCDVRGTQCWTAGAAGRTTSATARMHSRRSSALTRTSARSLRTRCPYRMSASRGLFQAPPALPWPFPCSDAPRERPALPLCRSSVREKCCTRSHARAAKIEPDVAFVVLGGAVGQRPDTVRARHAAHERRAEPKPRPRPRHRVRRASCVLLDVLRRAGVPAELGPSCDPLRDGRLRPLSFSQLLSDGGASYEHLPCER